ncbi:MAG TPA: YfiR family protein [Acidobacteriaceae bacterium]|nr:YfiR family protein [Acidobacteriaceae bacterium]
MTAGVPAPEGAGANGTVLFSFRKMRRRVGWLGGVVALLMLTAQVGHGQKSFRDDVQAAYLYNFGKFVRWPQSADRGPMLVCIAGRDPIGQAVAKLVAGEEIDGRRVEERDLDSPEDEGACSILFVGLGEHAREDSFLMRAEGKPILTVGDGPDFLARGGMIQFILVGDHVRFAVNLEAINRHRIAVSSELLKVAVKVTGNPGPGGVK